MRRGRRNPSLLLIEEGESGAPFLFSFRSEQLSPPSSSPYSLFLPPPSAAAEAAVAPQRKGRGGDGRPTNRPFDYYCPLGGER